MKLPNLGMFWEVFTNNEENVKKFSILMLTFDKGRFKI